MSKILIRGGRVVTMNEKQEILERADILVDGGTIASVAAAGDENEETANVEVDTVIDAEVGSYAWLVRPTYIFVRHLQSGRRFRTWIVKARIWPLEGGHDEKVFVVCYAITELIKVATAIIDMETVHHTESASKRLMPGIGPHPKSHDGPRKCLPT